MTGYSTEQFFADSQNAGREVLFVAEWIVVVVAFSWAAETATSTALYYFALVLNLLLAAYVAVLANRFLWWIAPSIGPEKPRSVKTLIGALASLAIGWAIFMFTELSFNALLCAESSFTKQVQCDANRPAAERTLYPSWLREKS